eukprot:gene8554-377_t
MSTMKIKNLTVVTVDPEITSLYQELKMKEKYSWLVYNMDSTFEKIEFLSKSEENTVLDLNELRKHFPENECRMATILYKWKLENNSERAKILHICWCPLASKVKERMCFAGAIGYLLKETKNEFILQADDMDGLSDDVIYEKLTQFSFTNNHSNLDIDFKNIKTATIIKNALEVDEELSELCKRKIELKGTILHVNIQSPQARPLRASVKGFFQSLTLCTETMIRYGEEEQ